MCLHRPLGQFTSSLTARLFNGCNPTNCNMQMGLFADQESLFVAGFYLRRIDLKSKEVVYFGDDAVLEDLESIEPAPDGGFFRNSNWQSTDNACN